MKISGAKLLIWLLCTLVYAAFLALIVRRGEARNWPSLVAYCAAEAGGNVLLYLNLEPYSTYFYLFWAREALLAALRFWIFADCVRAVPAIREFPRNFSTVSCAMGVLAAAISWITTFSEPPNPTIVDRITMLNRCIGVSWAAMMVTLLLCIATCGFGFLVRTLRVGTGYLVLILTGLAVAPIYTSNLRGSIKLFANTVSNTMEVVVVLYWIYTFQAPADAEPTAQQRAQIEASYRALTNHLPSVQRPQRRLT